MSRRVLVIESDANVRGMMVNHRFAGAIGDSGWGEFARMLVGALAARRGGREVVLVYAP